MLVTPDFGNERWDDNKGHYGMLIYFLGSQLQLCWYSHWSLLQTPTLLYWWQMPRTPPFEALLWGPLLKRGYSSFSAKGDIVEIVSHKC